MKLDRGFKIKSSNPTSEIPKISFSCGLDTSPQAVYRLRRLFYKSHRHAHSASSSIWTDGVTLISFV